MVLYKMKSTGETK
ncbi:hypothetical protein NGA_0702200, partial [Nannochloropsis gaditana CCMP526]